MSTTLTGAIGAPTYPAIAPGAAACLASLPAGAWGTVVRLGDRLGHSQRAQLMEMGLVPGTSVGRLAAGGAQGPVVVQLRGYLLTLGRGEASSVEVVPQPSCT